MGHTDVSSNYYQGKVDKIDIEIRSFDEVIREAQERKQAAVQLREMMVSQLGLDTINPATAFCDLSVREAVRQALLSSSKGRKPKEIVEFMLKKGYTFPPKTEKGTRVSNELIYLMKANLVTKEDGLYCASGGGAT